MPTPSADYPLCFKFLFLSPTVPDCGERLSLPEEAQLAAGCIIKASPFFTYAGLGLDYDP
jgi:hypothetical protein